jgi:hypothetical protein
MSRLAYLCLGSLLSLAGGFGPAFAYDVRIDPNATRRAEISVAFTSEPKRTLADSADGTINSGDPRLPRSYAPAMTWYRLTLAGGYRQAPIVARGWSHDELLPEPLQWAWLAENGDVVMRMGRGVFRLSIANNRTNWFREVDCQLVSWPDGKAEAPMACNDGSQRMMQIPGDGLVRVDGMQFTRVFQSDATVLPPEETLEEIMARQDLATTAAVAGRHGGGPEPGPAEEAAPAEETAQAREPASAEALAPVVEYVPIPRPRPDVW